MKNSLRRALVGIFRLLLQLQSRPYTFRCGRALVVAPHADDETLGCGGIIAAKTGRGDAVDVVFITDSAAAWGQNQRGNSAAVRRREALAALRVLGVPEDRTHFLDAPDGRLDRLDGTESRRLQESLVALLRSAPFSEIFLPYLGGGSTEHDAAIWPMREAIAVAGIPRPVVWEYPVWAWWNPLRLRRQLARFEENYHFELGPWQAVKNAALRHHESQLQPEATPALPGVLVDACTGPVEFYFHRRR